jgi:hypothetical protein
VFTVKSIKRFIIAFSLPIVLAGGGSAAAQSSDPNLPTAVLSNEVTAKVVALDLGDPRMTRHYYAFEGTPGDLIISINSRNLNGDMDVFTAVSLRPLMKISIYANTIPPEVTKSIYLRTKQILILRVEARSPNDDDGNYRIRFGGAFAPFSGGIPVAQNTEETSEVASSRSGTRRVSSVGATIAEPPAETSAASPEPTPGTETAAEKTAEEEDTKKTAATKSARTKPTRSSSTARNPRRRPPARPKPKTDTEAAKSETGEPKKSASEGEGKPATEETQELSPQPGGRLIIERKDGTLIDRPMSTIRRVIVEGNQIVIVLKSGRTERIPLSNVTRMAIEPQ